MTETGQPTGPERHESLSERWFSTGLDQPTARCFMEYVLDAMFGEQHLDPPRLTDPSGPFVSNRRRPGFGASLITGRGGQRTGSGAPDAHIEVRLYPERVGTTVYLGVAALCCQHPRRWESRLLDAFERNWRAVGDDGLYRVRPPAYGI